MLNPRVSLDQWRALVAVVETGTFAAAAEQIHKTQSSVSYAVQKIEQQLDLSLFERQGRSAVLTAAGMALYRRAKNLLERADSLELGAVHLRDNWDPELRLAVDIVYPTWSLLQSLDRFSSERPQTRVQLFETVLGGTDEALFERAVDLAITTAIPQGFSGDPLLRITFIAAAHPDHPLHHMGRPVTLDDLRNHRHLVVRDNALRYTRESGGWLGSEQRWTVSNKATQIAAACQGMGFAWFPQDTIQNELNRGNLKPLNMREGGKHFAQMYLVFADPDFPTASAVRMAEILRKDVPSH